MRSYSSASTPSARIPVQAESSSTSAQMQKTRAATVDPPERRISPRCVCAPGVKPHTASRPAAEAPTTALFAVISPHAALFSAVFSTAIPSRAISLSAAFPAAMLPRVISLSTAFPAAMLPRAALFSAAFSTVMLPLVISLSAAKAEKSVWCSLFMLPSLHFLYISNSFISEILSS